MKHDWKTIKKYEDILFEQSGGIAKITINRPEVYNAFRPQTNFEMLDAMNYCRSTPELSPLHAHAWVGIYVRPEWRRSGYALEMLRLAAAYASSTLRLSRIGARVLDSNEASIALFRRAGYRYCGMIPKWHFAKGGFEDMHIFCIDIS